MKQVKQDAVALLAPARGILAQGCLWCSGILIAADVRLLEQHPCQAVAVALAAILFGVAGAKVGQGSACLCLPMPTGALLAC